MDTLYFDCSMGAGGDTIAAALLELTDNKDKIVADVNSIFANRIGIIAKSMESCGTKGTGLYTIGRSATNADRGERHRIGRHRVLQDMIDIINTVSLDKSVRKNVVGIFHLLAESVSKTRGRTIEEAHLHSIASIDNIIMIVTVCLAMEELRPKHIIASPVCVGVGYTHSVYGTVPVPTPSAAYLLTGIPTFAGKFEGELCTTVGAAILKWFVKDFKPMPIMSVKKTGCGIGKEKFTSANCLRIFYGDIVSTGTNSEITELVCSSAEMKSTELTALQNRLLQSGAEEIFVTPIHLMGNQPGIKLTCICDLQYADRLSVILLTYTTASFVKRSAYLTYKLTGDEKNIQTQYGSIRVKKYSGYGLEKNVPIYEDVKSSAALNNMSADEMYIEITDVLNRKETV